MNKDIDHDGYKVSKLVYLASPYTHENTKKMKTRFVQICKVAALLQRKGIFVLCPIASSHPIATYGNIVNTDWEYWKKLDTTFISHCDEVWITMLDEDWQKSVGMRAEALYAHAHSIPVRLINKKGRILSTSEKDILQLFDLVQETL